jgi:hypothetical protein
MSKNNNEPAFPHAAFGYMGMTLRDYFAAKAMQGFLMTYADFPYDSIATQAYKMADDMLEAREK